MDSETLQQLQIFTQWAGVAGGAAYFTLYTIFFAYFCLAPRPKNPSWLFEVIEKHPRVAIFLPLSALAAFCLVVILQVSTGGVVKFEGLGFKFEGASGQVTLWTIVFLAIIFAVKLLWPKDEGSKPPT